MAMKNPYKDEISFAQLAKDDADFADILKPNNHLDFSDPGSVLQLTKSLLKRDFNLNISLLPDRLCPPVPNRLNYLLWIDPLLESSKPYGSPPDRQIIGLDIGTGASAIYPLLGCASNPSWSFVATDIDEKSLDYARQNIETNNLSSRIRLIKCTPDGPLIPLQDGERLDFTMCNPPFYSSDEELKSSAGRKSKPPNSACTGSPNEMVCPGGEVAFISRIIEESLVLRERVQWYTSMVGKLSSLVPLIGRLKTDGCTNWAVGELVQGSKTRRWVLGWSWDDWRPSLEVARGVGAGTLEKKYLPFPGGYTVEVLGKSKREIGGIVDEGMKALDMRWEWDAGKLEGVGCAEGNVWGRAARRKTKNVTPDMGKEGHVKTAEMAFRVKIEVKEEEGRTVVTVKWIKGFDSVLFESFCGMVKRIVEAEQVMKRKAEDTAAEGVVKKSRS